MQVSQDEVVRHKLSCLDIYLTEVGEDIQINRAVFDIFPFYESLLNDYTELPRLITTKAQELHSRFREEGIRNGDAVEQLLRVVDSAYGLSYITVTIIIDIGFSTVSGLGTV